MYYLHRTGDNGLGTEYTFCVYYVQHGEKHKGLDFIGSTIT